MGCIRFKVKGNQKAFYQDPQDPFNDETKRYFCDKILDYNGVCYEFKGEKLLQPGIYSINFSFILPQDIPASINHHNK